ncbi:hypothetical protein P692DRAFT_20883968 [Suillus brevipes Sb2]|nr:hypothetical protein P692DRAFT_20883968 [Suillus brevipes Sb2]
MGGGGCAFAQASKQLSDDDMDEGVEAKEEGVWCLKVFETFKDIEDRDIDKARWLWRIGRCYWDLGGITTHAFTSYH